MSSKQIDVRLLSKIVRKIIIDRKIIKTLSSTSEKRARLKCIMFSRKMILI